MFSKIRSVPGKSSLFTDALARPLLNEPAPIMPPYIEQAPNDAPGIQARLLGLINDLQTTDPDMVAEQEALLGLAAKFGARVDRFLEKIAVQRHEKLLDEHEEIKDAGAKQEARCAEVERDVAERLREWNKKKSIQSQCLAELDSAKADRQTLSRWATAKQIRQADQRIESAEAVWRDAQQEQGAGLRDYNAGLAELGEARKKLEEIKARETCVRADLEGRVITDPFTGLVRPPGGLGTPTFNPFKPAA